jgi:hypothetical protein
MRRARKAAPPLSGSAPILQANNQQRCIASGDWPPERTGRKQEAATIKGARAMQRAQGWRQHIRACDCPAEFRSIAMPINRNANEKPGAEFRPGANRQFQFPE